MYCFAKLSRFKRNFVDSGYHDKINVKCKQYMIRHVWSIKGGFSIHLYLVTQYSVRDGLIVSCDECLLSLASFWTFRKEDS